MADPQWLQLPISGTNVHGPNDIWATEIWLYVLLLSVCAS